MSNTRRPKNPALGRQQSTRRSTQAAVVGFALLCVAAIVAIALVLGSSSGAQPSASSPGAASNSSAPPSAAGTTPASAPTSALPANLHCEPAPALPAQPQTFAKPPSRSLSGNSAWVATISTNCGDITVRLDGADAPQTVASFIFLARSGFFDDTACPRLATSGIFVLQCGDPTGTGGGDPGYAFGIENAPKNGDYPPGTLAMARSSAPKSNGSQFFVVYKDTRLPTAGGGYSIFGRVTHGLDIVKALAQAGVGGGSIDGPPAQPVSILSVTVKKT